MITLLQISRDTNRRWPSIGDLAVVFEPPGLVRAVEAAGVEWAGDEYTWTFRRVPADEAPGWGAL